MIHSQVGRFLRTRGVDEDVIEKFKEEKVSFGYFHPHVPSTPLKSVPLLFEVSLFPLCGRY